MILLGSSLLIPVVYCPTTGIFFALFLYNRVLSCEEKSFCFFVEGELCASSVVVL